MGIRNLGSLEVFVALADTQSFTEAAKRLGMTTSAASQALKALEEELAVALRASFGTFAKAKAR